MTDKLRPRLRATVSDGDPLALDAAKLPAWFAGVGPAPWHALLPDLEPKLWQEWRLYKKTHRNAQPPQGYLWLDNAAPPRK